MLEYLRLKKKPKSSLTEEWEDLRLSKYVVKWQMEFSVRKCSEGHGGTVLYN